MVGLERLDGERGSVLQYTFGALHQVHVVPLEVDVFRRVRGWPGWLGAGSACYRLFRWCLWTAAISLLPFLGVAAVQSLSFEEWNGFQPIIGSGQLFPTCIALLIGGVKELSSSMSNNVRPKWRDFSMWASVSSCMIITLVYGFLLGQVVAGGVDVSSQNTVTSASVYVFATSFLVAALAVMISAPAAEVAR